MRMPVWTLYLPSTELIRLDSASSCRPHLLSLIPYSFLKRIRFSCDKVMLEPLSDQILTVVSEPPTQEEDFHPEWEFYSVSISSPLPVFTFFNLQYALLSKST
ncbi:MAG: hypothetical protein JWO53_363 [Chlamydiia bacterium]|nr:hypothetical protein [Chlamydiia bacterium]